MVPECRRGGTDTSPERTLRERYAAGERDFSGIDLRGAKLGGAVLVGAIFRGADLCGAEHLFAPQLAGANLSGAAIGDLDMSGAFKDAEAAAGTAAGAFLTMLLVCAYVILTIAATTDAKLLTNPQSWPLPIIQ